MGVAMAVNDQVRGLELHSLDQPVPAEAQTMLRMQQQLAWLVQPLAARV